MLLECGATSGFRAARRRADAPLRKGCSGQAIGDHAGANPQLEFLWRTSLGTAIGGLAAG
eukprot:scaffold149_cov315-Pinguiococcus_pyrenoidosus.AAC.133